MDKTPKDSWSYWRLGASSLTCRLQELHGLASVEGSSYRWRSFATLLSEA
jgi:hypothetical protein